MPRTAPRCRSSTPPRVKIWEACRAARPTMPARPSPRAEAAFAVWRKVPLQERGAKLRRWGELIEEHIDDLCRILTLEQGKPLAEARGEILQGATYFPWFAEEIRRAYGDVVPAPRAGVRPLTQKAAHRRGGRHHPLEFPLLHAAPQGRSGHRRRLPPSVVKPASATNPTARWRWPNFPAVRASRPGSSTSSPSDSGTIGREITQSPVVAQAELHRLHRRGQAACRGLRPPLLKQLLSLVTGRQCSLHRLRRRAAGRTLWPAPWGASSATLARPASAPTVF